MLMTFTSVELTADQHDEEDRDMHMDWSDALSRLRYQGNRGGRLGEIRREKATSH